MTEQLPADIAAAIEAAVATAKWVGHDPSDEKSRRDLTHVRAALDAAILARLTVAAEDDAEATCRAVRAEKTAEEIAYWQDAARHAEAQRDMLRGKLDEMFGQLMLAEGSCAKLREEIAGLRGSHECVEQHLEDVCAENERLREAIQSAVTEAKDLSGRLHRSHAWNQSAVSSWLANHAGKLERAALSPAAEEAKLPGLWNTLTPDQQRRILESGDDV